MKIINSCSCPFCEKLWTVVNNKVRYLTWEDIADQTIRSETVVCPDCFKKHYLDSEGELDQLELLVLHKANIYDQIKHRYSIWKSGLISKEGFVEQTISLLEQAEKTTQ